MSLWTITSVDLLQLESEYSGDSYRSTFYPTQLSSSVESTGLQLTSRKPCLCLRF